MFPSNRAFAGASPCRRVPGLDASAHQAQYLLIPRCGRQFDAAVHRDAASTAFVHHSPAVFLPRTPVATDVLGHPGSGTCIRIDRVAKT
jgi:hypothetical protein